MEVLFDGGRKTSVVVDLSLQLIYCVLQTSYSKTFELFGRGVSFLLLSFLSVCLCSWGWQATSARSPLVSILQHRMCARYRANFADKPGAGERGRYGDDGDRDDGDDDDDGDDITVDGVLGGGVCVRVYGVGGVVR